MSVSLYFDLIRLPFRTLEESAARLREVHNGSEPAVGFLISEIAMRWKETCNIGDFNATPIKRLVTAPVVKGGRQITYQEPYSNLLFLTPKGRKVEDFVGWFDSDIGLAISSIVSFVMRRMVIAYNEPNPPYWPISLSDIIPPFMKSWVAIWNKNFSYFVGIRRRISTYHPSPEEEKTLIETMNSVYDIVLGLGEKEYYELMAAMRLYQLAHLIVIEDESLAYGLLVAAIESLSSRGKTIKFKDIDRKGSIVKALEEAGLDENMIAAVKNQIVQASGVKKRFCDFVVDNLPSTFWEGDYSLSREMNRMIEEESSGQYYRDLSEYLPEPEKQEIMKLAEEQQRQYEERNKRKKENEKLIKVTKREKIMLDYFRTFLRKVLANTYDCRSILFHGGKSFPKKALEERIFLSWVPDLIEDESAEFLEKHNDHQWNYRINRNNGEITRVCSCGNEESVKMMLDLRVFERVVHDAILNYIIKLSVKTL